MRIKVSSEAHTINFVIPTRLLINRYVFDRVMNYARKHEIIEISKQHEDLLYRMLKHSYTYYKDLKLLEIESANHEIVEITL